ncbi:MAG: AGE family epimerase/isomerase [Granulosicoccus sp.]|nr:AGE family epimerase/isomerase [Granulosicoccus sp.]
MSLPAEPDFTSRAFLNAHVQFILKFYEPNVRAADGGFHQCFMDDGSVYDKNLRHLVSSTRFVYNYANAYRHTQQSHYAQWASDGLDYLKRVHRQSAGHYAWVINNGQVADGRAMAYGHAFVMLAAASCIQHDITDANAMLRETWDFMEQYFWDEQGGAYADERDSSLHTLDPYRGQNANMHMCEALLAAYQASGQTDYLDRACQLAHRFAFDLAMANDGLIWEHYDSEWQSDMQYNIDKPDDLFKPWGFQPGHQVEWTKLLLQINDCRPDPDYLKRARELFDTALRRGWDDEFGGLVYGFAPDGSFCDSHKYFWVHAEACASAWRLYRSTTNDRYLDDYNRIWAYSWKHLIDHEQGAWFRIRNRDGSEFDKLKSPPGKTDYHTLGACWDILSQH